MIIGVEFVRQLNSIAQQNIRNYSDAEQQCYDMETKCIDAIKYDLPEENLVLFFYSPFSDAQIMRRILVERTIIGQLSIQIWSLEFFAHYKVY